MENNQAVSDDKQYQSVVDNTSAGVSENNQNNAWQITTMIIVGVVVLGLLLFGYMYFIRKQGVNIPVKTGTQITETVSPTLPISPTVTTDTQKKETLDLDITSLLDILVIMLAFFLLNLLVHHHLLFCKQFLRQ